MRFTVKVDRAPVLSVPSASLVPNGNLMNNPFGDEDGWNFVVPSWVGSTSSDSTGISRLVKGLPVGGGDEQVIIVRKI